MSTTTTTTCVVSQRLHMHMLLLYYEYKRVKQTSQGLMRERDEFNLWGVKAVMELNMWVNYPVSSACDSCNKTNNKTGSLRLLYLKRELCTPAEVCFIHKNLRALSPDASVLTNFTVSDVLWTQLVQFVLSSASSRSHSFKQSSAEQSKLESRSCSVSKPR